MKKRLAAAIAVTWLTFGTFALELPARANDIEREIAAIDLQMQNVVYLSDAWTALWNNKQKLQLQLQICTRDKNCPDSLAQPVPTKSASTSPSTSASPIATTAAPATSQAPQPTEVTQNPQSSKSPVVVSTNESTTGQSSASNSLLTYAEYIAQIQALDNKIVTATGSVRSALIQEKNALTARYQADVVKATENYQKVQQEYVEQLAVITARDQAAAQADLIAVATKEALTAGVPQTSLKNWQAAQDTLATKVAELEEVISNFDGIYTPEAIAGMTIDNVQQTTVEAVAYKNELETAALKLASLAISEIVVSGPATSLTSQQTEVLTRAASVTFEYAEPGSIPYEKALEALWVVAQSNDNVVDESLASVPVLGALASAIVDGVNYLGNVGSDMSPAVRDDAEKVVVSAVVATQVAQVAVGASMLAPAPSAGLRKT